MVAAVSIQLNRVSCCFKVSYAWAFTQLGSTIGRLEDCNCSAGLVNSCCAFCCRYHLANLQSWGVFSVLMEDWNVNFARGTVGIITATSVACSCFDYCFGVFVDSFTLLILISTTETNLFLWHDFFIFLFSCSELREGIPMSQPV